MCWVFKIFSTTFCHSTGCCSHVFIIRIWDHLHDFYCARNFRKRINQHDHNCQWILLAALMVNYSPECRRTFQIHYILISLLSWWHSSPILCSSIFFLCSPLYSNPSPYIPVGKGVEWTMLSIVYNDFYPSYTKPPITPPPGHRGSPLKFVLGTGRCFRSLDLFGLLDPPICIGKHIPSGDSALS